MSPEEKRHQPLLIIAAIPICLAGLGVVLYPMFGNHIRSFIYEVVTPDPDPDKLAIFMEEIHKYDWGTDMVIAIAKAESKLDFDARGDTDLTFIKGGREYGYSLGALQVRILEGREHCDTLDIPTNVKCAYDIYEQRGWTAWTKYNDGSYRIHMPKSFFPYPR